MDTQKVIDTFTEFYRDRGHQRITGSTLLPPPGDPVLFTTSGMHPLTRYLEGLPHPARHPPGQRPALPAHHRPGRRRGPHPPDPVRDARLLVAGRLFRAAERPLGLRTAHRGVRHPAPATCTSPSTAARTSAATSRSARTPEMLEVWGELGVPVELTGQDNWWSNGPTGLCGTDSEIFVWTGHDPARGHAQHRRPLGRAVEPRHAPVLAAG